MSSTNKISWYEFSYWGNEKQYVNEVLDSTWISGGAYIEKFEQSLSKKLQLPNAVVVSNGTAALQLAFLGIGIKPGDEIIVPAFGFMAAANVLKQMHAVPIFVDVHPDYWCIDSKKLQEKITAKTKAIVVIYNYGIISEIEEIVNIAKKNNVFLIEDCAESIFSKYNGHPCGSFGDVSTFSFHATKTIATGEGGMVTCKDESLLDKLRLIRSHGLRRAKKHYWHEDFGNNFRMPNIMAAIGFGQLEKSEVILSEKDRVYNRYQKNLADLKKIRFQKFFKNTEIVVWAIALYLTEEITKNISRDEILNEMSLVGIECRPGFYTPNQLTIYKNEAIEINNVANDLAANIIVLPSYPGLKDHQIDEICASFKTIINRVI